MAYRTPCVIIKSIITLKGQIIAQQSDLRIKTPFVIIKSTIALKGLKPRRGVRIQPGCKRSEGPLCPGKIAYINNLP